MPGGEVIEVVNGSRDRNHVDVRRGGVLVQRVSLEALRDEWLKDDALWGGHSLANGMRYQNTHGGGFLTTLEEPHLRGAAVWGVLTWQDLSPSHQPLVAQFLVRIQTRPKPALVRVKTLTMTLPWLDTRPPLPPRLYEKGRRLFVFDRGALAEVSKERVSDPLARFPDSLAPLGVLDGRWLLLYWRGREAGPPLWSLDLDTRSRPKPVAGPWTTSMFYTNNVSIPQDGSKFLFVPQDDASLLVITLPRGRLVRIPNPRGSGRFLLWRGTVVIREEDRLALYNAPDGHFIGRLPL